MTVAAGGIGPSPELLAIQGRASAAPSYMALGPAAAGLKARIIAARDFEDLSAEDRLFLTACLREVEDGASPVLTDPVEWGGDWAAADAELGSGAVQTEEVKPPDDDGWVGV